MTDDVTGDNDVPTVLREIATQMEEERQGFTSFRDEVEAVLVMMDELATVWGDEGVFRRCRDRLREALAKVA